MVTKRQKQLLDYLRDYIEKHGYAPTLEEIGKHFSLSSLATVHKHLQNLERKGRIRRLHHHSRAMEVVPEPSFGAVFGKVAILILVILFIQRRPSGLFAAKGRYADS